MAGTRRRAKLGSRWNVALAATGQGEKRDRARVREKDARRRSQPFRAAPRPAQEARSIRAEAYRCPISETLAPLVALLGGLGAVLLATELGWLRGHGIAVFFALLGLGAAVALSTAGGDWFQATAGGTVALVVGLVLQSMRDVARELGQARRRGQRRRAVYVTLGSTQGGHDATPDGRGSEE
jgi:hypothetical protein